MKQDRLKQSRSGAFAGILACLALAACDPAAQSGVSEPGVFAPTTDGPPGAPPGTCWGRTVSPAVVQTVKEQVQIKPAKINPDGTIASLPLYRTVERQQIVTSRVDNWFETPCPGVLTPEFISSLQRALIARGAYGGAVNGRLDRSTRTAIRNFQMANGPDSEVLTLATARQLGLIAVSRQGDT